MASQEALLEPLLQEGNVKCKPNCKFNCIEIINELLRDLTFRILVAATVISLVARIFDDSEEGWLECIAILIAATLWIILIIVVKPKQLALVESCAKRNDLVNENNPPNESVLVKEDDGANDPMPKKLRKLTSKIGIFGLIIALLFLGTLIIYLAIDTTTYEWTDQTWSIFLSSFVFATIIVAIAVPGGLFIAFTLSFSHSLNQIKKKNIFIKNLKSFEAIGQTNDLCVDPSGILYKDTEEILSMYCEKREIENINSTELSPAVKELLCEHVVYNTSAGITYEIENNKNIEKFFGSKIDIALLKLACALDPKYLETKNSDLIAFNVPFNSKLKKSVMVLKKGDGYIVLVKGNKEVVLNNCCKIVGKDGIEQDITENDKAKINEIIKDNTEKAYRVQILAYKYIDTNFPIPSIPTDGNEVNLNELESNLTLLCVCGIGNPINEKAENFIKTCKNYSINIKIITGEITKNAVVLAKRCGILSENYEKESPEDVVLEGQVFRQKIRWYIDDPNYSGGNINDLRDSYFNLKKLQKNLRVFARSSPEDKYLLVASLHKIWKFVAVVSNSTADAPALSLSDVGICLEDSSTDLAKQASDIHLLDNNLSNIKTLIVWSRNFFDTLHKFIQFQLTVSSSALLLIIICVITYGRMLFTVIQLLWIFLIIDILATLAFVSEPLQKKNLGKAKHYLITKDMMTNIIGQLFYQSVWLLVILFLGPDILGISHSFAADPRWVDNSEPLIEEWTEENGVHLTVFFNTFVFLQIFNKIYCRRVKSTEFNVFQGILKSWIFLAIIALTVIVQIILVEFGGKTVKCSPLTIEQHGICVAIGLGGLLFGILIKFMPNLPFKFIEISAKA